VASDRLARRRVGRRGIFLVFDEVAQAEVFIVGDRSLPEVLYFEIFTDLRIFSSGKEQANQTSFS